MKPRLLVYHAGQCDPKRCTGLKLKKFGLATLVQSESRIPSGAILLNPFSQRVLSKDDASHLRRGIVALDCSWKKAEEVFAVIGGRIEGRALPLLIAANPINYGQIGKLSTAEALSASLYILGYKEEGKEMLSKFKWGASFLSLNGEILESYASAGGSKELLSIQREYFKEVLG